MEKNLLIFGVGECGALARFYFEQDSGRKVDGFVADDLYVKSDSFDGLPVIPLSETTGRFPPDDYEMHVAIAYGGSNAFRQRKFESCQAAGYTLASYVSTKAALWSGLIYGENCLILEHASVQPGARIGSNVVVGTGCRVAHGNVVKDHVYLSSQVCCGGNCEIGERSFFGLGSQVKELSKVGPDCFIAMGAAVTRDLPPKSVVLAPNSTIADPETAEFVRKRALPDPELDKTED